MFHINIYKDATVRYVDMDTFMQLTQINQWTFDLHRFAGIEIWETTVHDDYDTIIHIDDDEP